MNKGLFAGCNFADVASGEDVKIATIDDITKDKIGSDDCDIGKDVGRDDDDVADEGVFTIEITNTAVP